MDAQLKRGLTEACVLALLSAGDSYGYKLARDTKALIPLSESTLYPVLKRLQEAGSVDTYSVEHGGRLRRYYRVTPSGRRQMSAFLKEWETLNKVYTYIKQMHASHQGEEA